MQCSYAAYIKMCLAFVYNVYLWVSINGVVRHENILKAKWKLADYPDLAEYGLDDPTDGGVGVAVLRIPSPSQMYLPKKSDLLIIIWWL